jgi:hypothetical protein
MLQDPSVFLFVKAHGAEDGTVPVLVIPSCQFLTLYYHSYTAILSCSMLYCSLVIYETARMECTCD